MQTANSDAQSRANAAYAAYQSTAASAYESYQQTEAQAKATLLHVIDNANTAISTAINSAGAAWSAAINAANVAVNASLTVATSTLDATMSAADAAFIAAADAAWADGDIAGVDQATAAWYQSLESAAEMYNATFDGAVATFVDSVGTAYDVLGAAIEAAEQSWETSVQAGVDAYTEAEGAAWDGYRQAESAAWDQYQNVLAATIAEQNARINQAVDTYLSDIAAADARYRAAETVLWDRYLADGAQGDDGPQTGTATHTSGTVGGGSGGSGQGSAPPVRLQNPPALGDMPPIAATLSDPGPRLADKDRGKLPPIDWSKGKNVRGEEDVSPWNEDGPSGAIQEQVIGKDAKGKEIKIRTFSAATPYNLEWSYNCHGLTFSGLKGVTITESSAVQKLLDTYYKQVQPNQAVAGDIILYKDAAGDWIHSCTIVTLVLNADGTINPTKTVVRSKNGQSSETTGFLNLVDAIYLTPGVSRILYSRN